MANSRSSDWSDQHPGGRFRVYEGTGRGHTGQEPPYYLNGYEHEGYEEQPGASESDELAHDDGYLPGWAPGPAYRDMELDYADAELDYWDTEPEPGYAGAEPGYAGAEPGYAGAEPGYAGAEPGYAGAKPRYPDYAGAEPDYPGAEPDYAGPGYRPPVDPWDTQDSGYAFPAAWRWQDPGVPSPRDPRARPDPGTQPDLRTWRGRADNRAASRPPRTLWMAAIGAVGLVATVLVFRWVGEAPPASAPAAHTHSAAAPAAAMPAAGMATPSYRLIAAKQADGFGYNATASHRMATATATAGGAAGLARCLEAKGLNGGGTVTAVRYAQYNDGRDVTGLSLIGFGGTFGPGTARQLWQATASCGALAPGGAASTAAPGPHGGTLYTGTGNPDGTTCAWATGTTAALVWFFNGMTGLTVRDPATACQAVRSAVEARPLCRTYACCARA